MFRHGFRKKTGGNVDLGSGTFFVPLSCLLFLFSLIFTNSFTFAEEVENNDEDTRETYVHPPAGTILIDPDDDNLQTLVGPPWLKEGGVGLLPKESIPTSYDWRDNNKCLMNVRDQGSCGNCWAVAAVIVYQARWCLKTGQKVEMSIEDLTECDHTYALGVTNKGCNGGHFIPSFIYASNTGMTDELCSPYTYHKIPYPYPQLDQCKNTCDNSPTRTKPRYISKGYYRLSGIAQIQQDILLNGPVAAQIKLYGNLGGHKSGVYKCDYSSGYRGGHTVAIVGWGTDPVEGDYWIVENTWGSKYHENGYLKFRRGKNDCGIEEVIAAPNIAEITNDDSNNNNDNVTQGEIEIKEPEAYSALVKGQITSIRWKTTNISGGNSTLKITYYKGTTTTTSNKISEVTIATVKNTQGYYNWTVPTPPTSTTFGILTVSTTLGSTTVTDTVRVIPMSSAPTIRSIWPIVTSPSSSSLIWPVGSKQNVQFSSTCTDCRYRIRITKSSSTTPSGDTNPLFASNYVSSTSISFVMPDSMDASTTYKVYIDILGIMTTSTHVCNVKSSSGSSVTVSLISPDKEMSVVRGTPIVISWKVFDKDGNESRNKVTLQWVRDGFTAGYDLGTFDPGSYEWVVPESMGLTKYRVKVTVVGSTSDITEPPTTPGVSDISPPIMLVKTTENPTIFVNTPNAYTVWKCGPLNSHNISWTSSGVNSVDIKLYKNNEQVLVFATNASNTGSLLVNVPCDVLSNSMRSSDFSIRILVTDSDIYALSNHFTIENDYSTTEDCGLTSFIYPSSGSSWVTGTRNLIQIGVKNISIDDFHPNMTLNKNNSVIYTFDTPWEVASDCDLTYSGDSSQTQPSTPTHCFKSYVTVPTSVSLGTYTLKATNISERICSGSNQVSTTINIIANTSNVLKISSVKTVGESTEGKLVVGRPYNITWVSRVPQNNNYITIEILDKSLRSILTLDEGINPGMLSYRGFLVSCVERCSGCYIQIKAGSYLDKFGVNIVSSSSSDDGNNNGSNGGNNNNGEDEDETTDDPLPDKTKDIDIYVPNSTTNCLAANLCPLKWYLKSEVEKDHNSLTIILYTTSSLYMYISRDWPIKNVGYPDWRLPSDIPSGKYYLIIRTTCYPVVSDKSDTFTITNKLTTSSIPEFKYMISWDMDKLDSDKVTVCFAGSPKDKKDEKKCLDTIIPEATNNGVVPWNTRVEFKDIGEILVCGVGQEKGEDVDCTQGSINAVDDAAIKMSRSIVMWASFLLTSFVFAILLK